MATIIKPESLQHASGTAFRQVAYDLTDMAAEADDYLGGVRREAAKIVEQARSDAAVVRQEAEAAGRAAEEAIERILDEKISKQMKTLTPAFQAAAEQIRQSKQQWLSQWETAAVDLAAAIAGRLVRGELTKRPEISAAWVREALELAIGAGEIVIHLHPGDCEAMERQAAQLAAAMHPTADVRVVADDTVSAGGCRVATEFGAVDMQLEAQLERIKQELN